MPRARHSKKTVRSSKSEYFSPQEVPITPGSLVATATIPAFNAQMPYRKSFRFRLNNAVGLTSAWTTNMMLDLYCIAVGGSATPTRIYNNMKLLGIKAWATPAAADALSSYETQLIIEFSPSTTAGFGGAPRTPHTAVTASPTKYAHLCVKPKKSELASQWFSAQQTVYTLFNLECPADTIFQIDFLVTEVNGETPVACAYASSVTKGIVGVTNFGISGCRAIGLENLVSP